MNFNPELAKQDKITTQILIEHALTSNIKQSALAEQLGIPESRITDSKKRDFAMPTESAVNLIKIYGMPESVFGEYHENCVYLNSSSNIRSYLLKRNQVQQSIILQRFLDNLKRHYFYRQPDELSPTLTDIKVNDLLTDPHFIAHATKLIEPTYQPKESRYSKFFYYGLNLNEDLPNISSSSLSNLLNKYQLSELDESPQERLKGLLFAAYTMNLCNELPHTHKLMWSPLPTTETFSEKSLPIVITGAEVDEFDYFDSPINLYNDRNSDNVHTNKLNCSINELERMTREYRNYELRPIGHSFDSYIGIQLISTALYFKRSQSTFTLVLGIKSSDRIVEHSKLPLSNIVIPDITPKQMLDRVIPQLQNLADDSNRLLYGMSDFSIKRFFAENGIMVPGAHVI